MFLPLAEATDHTLIVSPQQQTDIWQQSLTLPTAWGRWNTYLNQLCLVSCLTWLQAEHLPTIKADMEQALWGMINGSILTAGNLRIALVPTEAIDRSELVVPQEWVDIPSWVADYYLGVQIAPGCQEITIYGYTTHQQLKIQGSYDAQERNYCLDLDDLIVDLNTLWLCHERYTASQTRAAVAALPTLELDQTEQLIIRLGNPAKIMPRLEVPFASWGALLSDPRSRKKLCQLRQSSNTQSQLNPTQSNLTKLKNWLQGQFDDAWQALEQVLLPQQLAIAVRSNDSQNAIKIGTDNIYRAQVFNLDGGQIALLIGISPISTTESRINIQVHPAGTSAYLPGETQLRLLDNNGHEIGKVSAVVTETINLQFRVTTGEEFEIEIACGDKILTERFVL
jgi:Protein of unknown function (DUF1822)